MLIEWVAIFSIFGFGMIVFGIWIKDKAIIFSGATLIMILGIIVSANGIDIKNGEVITETVYTDLNSTTTNSTNIYNNSQDSTYPNFLGTGLGLILILLSLYISLAVYLGWV